MDLNRATIIGHVGKKPEYYAMASGDELCKFSVATSRHWKDKGTGESKEDTTWHNIVVFNPYLVDRVCKARITKGTYVFIEGEIKTRKYEKDGETRYITEIIVPQMKGEIFVLDKYIGQNVNETPGAERGKYSSGTGGPTQLGQAARTAVGREPGSDDEFEDDIPF